MHPCGEAASPSWKGRAPERAAALSLWTYSAVWLWYVVCHGAQAPWQPRPWHTVKRTPSFADALASLRRALWARRIFDGTDSCSQFAKFPAAFDQEPVKKDYWAILNGIEGPPGEAATSIAHQRADLFAEKWGQPYPRAVDCLPENLTALTAYLHFPAEHWERVRHSNLLADLR